MRANASLVFRYTTNEPTVKVNFQLLAGRYTYYCSLIVNRMVNCACSLTRVNQLYKCIEIRKVFIEEKGSSLNKHGPRFIVLGHQYGRRDVMYVKTFHTEKKKQRLLVLIVVINDE